MESKYATTPPLRVSDQADDRDSERASWNFAAWATQDAFYRLRDREAENHIRMLAGQQWFQYHHLLGWKDITDWMTDEEKRWRQRPVFNRLIPWYILTHARMTENNFICTFTPGPDRRDAEVSEVYDVLYKGVWRENAMGDIWDRAASWMIAAGASYLNSRIDLSKGDWESWVGRTQLPVTLEDGTWAEDPATGRLVLQDVDGVPFAQDGSPLAILHANGQLEPTGKPHTIRKGALVVDVLSPLEVRGEWGPKPWHEQRCHRMRSYLTPEEVFERWGVECEPDIRGEAAGSVGSLERILFGSGFYGAASGVVGSEYSLAGTGKDGYCTIQTSWYAPTSRVDGMEAGPGQPGGRLLVTTASKTLSDGPRPFDFRHTSPIRCYEFIRIPGRPGGSTPLEILISPQRAYNTGWKHILEYRALCTSPQQVYDLGAGLKKGQVDNRPGRRYGVNMRPGIDNPIKWIVPPPLAADTWRTQDQLAAEMLYLGAAHNTQPTQVSKDASGELIRELRFDEDRFLGPTMRRAAEEHGRLIEDWTVMWPLLNDVETVLKYTGEDNVARTLILMPDIFSAGHADVVPDTESMLPEGRGERRARIYKMWQDGAFGDPLSPEALRRFHELARFPHMSRTAKPGGVHQVTAEHENGEILRGGMPRTYPWYNHEVHLAVVEEFMSTPEWRRLPDDIKLGFILHRQDHLDALAEQAAAARAQAIDDALTAQAVAGGGKNGGSPKNGKPMPSGRNPRPGLPSRPATAAATGIVE